MSGRASKRERRQLAVHEMREVWSDEVFGLRFDQMSSGRPVFRWTMDHDPGVNLAGLERVQAFLEMAATEWVLLLRAEGESWADIGLLLGITGEAARRRFSSTEAEYLSAADRGGE